MLLRHVFNDVFCYNGTYGLAFTDEGRGAYWTKIRILYTMDTGVQTSDVFESLSRNSDLVDRRFFRRRT